MGGQRLKLWLMVVQPNREDIISSLEAAGCNITLGRSFQSAEHYTESEIVDKSEIWTV